MTRVLLVALLLLGSLPAEAQQRVDGIGGFFFRARDPKALAEWYRTELRAAAVAAGGGADDSPAFPR